MKLNLKTGVIFTAMGLAAYAAYAENVAISTYYPSPYGSYQTLDTTGTTNLATASGNVVIAAGGGNVILAAAASGKVGIGTATPLARLHITEGPAGQRAEILLESTSGNAHNWRISSDDNAGKATLSFQDVSAGVDAMRLTQDGNVGIGVASPTTKLDVNGRIRLTDGTNAGLLQVDCTTTPGSCYAVYA